MVPLPVRPAAAARGRRRRLVRVVGVIAFVGKGLVIRIHGRRGRAIEQSVGQGRVR